ncbi:hypothetical protein ALC60_10224 [Trachymyrmex zeteki]|uniref:Uncharacterized protein n=1 Tax=Mycetomoellerius zeteki TaxID=64791 RepID=A0A151WSB7_9HYME|nr:hypothetical protein ALC60_10224 [Trachymyrmex zeteki]
MERDLIEQATLLNTREKYVEWEQRCDEFIECLEEQSRIKCPRLSTGNRQSVIACIARLESWKDSVRERFMHVGPGYGLRWREIETAFESWILTDAVINSNYVEPRRFLEDASEIVLESVQCVLQRCDSLKINIVFNGEFIAGDKRANKSITTRNYELYKKFETLNISINVYAIEKRIVPIRLADRKRSKHVNLLYVEDDSAGHFALIKDLSRLVSSQINRYGHKKYFCDRYLHYFKSSAKLEIHSEDCGKLNDCAIRLPNGDDKWLSFRNHCRKELASFLNNDKLRVLRREFSDLSEEDFNLLTRKGVFPYEYIDCSEKLNELCLLPCESFYSSLTDNTVSEAVFQNELPALTALSTPFQNSS